MKDQQELLDLISRMITTLDDLDSYALEAVYHYAFTDLSDKVDAILAEAKATLK